MCGCCVWREVSRRGFGRAMAGAAACVSIAAAGHAPAGHATERDAPVEPRIRLADVPADQRMIALTFDCCPGAFDARIATVLVAERIPATIFVTWIGTFLRAPTAAT